MRVSRFWLLFILPTLGSVILAGCAGVPHDDPARRGVVSSQVVLNFPAWISESEKLSRLQQEASLRAKTLCGFDKPFDVIEVESREFKANFTFSFPQNPQVNQISGRIKCKYDSVTTASSELILDSSMECQTDKDCPGGSSCRSKVGGGTECRSEDGRVVLSTLSTLSELGCEQTSDCPSGMSCRSKVGGGAVCREDFVAESQRPDKTPALMQTNSLGTSSSTYPASSITPSLKSNLRIALLIGNASYQTSPLANPVNDVRGMAVALRNAGFTVMKHENLNFRQMREAVRDFGERLSKDHVGLFYYSGHGVQVDGKNYLIPVNSDIKYEDEVASSALDAEMVLAKLESAKNKLNIVVLDACRDSPLGRRTRTSTKGLSNMNAASGTMIAFSTAPGQVALDGKGSNSPYTKHLINAIQKEGLLLEQVFKEVRGNVMKDTNGTQVPWENSSILGDFYFVPVRKQK